MIETHSLCAEKERERLLTRTIRDHEAQSNAITVQQRHQRLSWLNFFNHLESKILHRDCVVYCDICAHARRGEPESAGPVAYAASAMAVNPVLELVAGHKKQIYKPVAAQWQRRIQRG